MVKLIVAFRGLCLFTRRDDHVRVYLPKADQAVSGKDNSRLPPHDTQLWLIYGESKGAQPKTRRVWGGQEVRYFDLSGNAQLRILNGESEPVELGDHLPSLKRHDTRVKDLAINEAKLAATFHVDRGSLIPAPIPTAVDWAGAHKGTSLKSEIPEFMLLLFETEDASIRISGHLGPGEFEFEPVDENGFVLLFVGAEPKPDDGHGHKSIAATHFKWLYELVDFKMQPSNLAHPIPLGRSVSLTVGPLTLSGSSFCPDGQYP